jgi:(1->4)-alpha-D-glucan 1-alpha-D-glucosylmutase
MLPRATYRIQFGKKFGFDQAASIAPYLAELGISHVYASPYLNARPGSEHGYDITDHNSLNSDLGDAPAFQKMLHAFRENNLEHILDYVPNHMGVGGADNPYWLDVLEWGQESQYAAWFDIDWHSHSEFLDGKLLVPFLADQYGAVLEAGKFEVKFDSERGEFSIWIYDTHKLPVTPPTYPLILGNEAPELERFADEFSALPSARTQLVRKTAELKSQLAQLVASDEKLHSALNTAIERFRGTTGQLDSWSKLDSLIREQNWRPTHFRVASDDINYRRFFNISELAGIRMELPEVFEQAHRFVFQLLSDGNLQGVRIDHVDGLYDPKEYLNRLREAAGVSFYLAVEKILASHEALQPSWPVDGTTGYEFCNQVTGLMIDPTAEPVFTRFYQEFTGDRHSFPDIAREAKIKIMENEMASELEALSREAVRIARENPRTTDFTLNILRRALKETIACFPVYRTYVDDSGRDETAERYIHWAISQATKNEQELHPTVFEFLEQALTGRLVDHSHSGYSRHSVIHFAMKVQQFSGPVMAKGLEDTAFYRYNRFIALNEVGGSPNQFGVSVSLFHKENQRRAEKWPHGMLTTSTHDTKRGEDARARLAALSLVPDEWTAKVAGWSRILRARRGDVEGTAPPARNDEYLFFQYLIASWPAELTLPIPLEPRALEAYSERLQGAMIKAIREARIRSNWISPDATYEGAIKDFVHDALDPMRATTFFENFLPFQEIIAQMGVRNSLVQLLLKMTSPGVADLYQGSELWDLNLPDPDNRRPVDFESRKSLLQRGRSDSSEDRQSRFSYLLTNWHDGAVKLAVLTSLLAFRRDHTSLFDSGAYEPLSPSEGSGDRIFAFLRIADEQACLVMASLDARRESTNTLNLTIPLGSRSHVSQWKDQITGKTVRSQNGMLKSSEVLMTLPIALLTPAQ